MAFFGCFMGPFPLLRSVWGLLLLVPFSIIFTVAYYYIFCVHSPELRKKLGESKEEQHRKLQAHLGAPFDPNARRR
jgi:hypothetical protein